VDDKGIRVVFGKQVRAIRKSRRVTQKQLAAAANTTGDTISNIERAATSTNINTAHRIADALGVELWELLRFPALFAGDEERQKLIDEFFELIETSRLDD